MQGLKLKSIQILFIIIGLVFISQLVVIPCLAQSSSRLGHENPDNIKAKIPYTIDIEVEVQLSAMIQSSYDIIESSYSSDHNTSKSYLEDYKNYYNNDRELLSSTKLSDIKFYQISPIMENLQNDFEIWIRDSEIYDAYYPHFYGYYSAGDMINATPYALQLRKSYQNLSLIPASFSKNAGIVAQMLEDTWINTTYLNMTSALMSKQLKNMTEKEKAVDELLNRTSLSLTPSRSTVRIGDMVDFEVELKTDGKAPVEGNKINLYINNVLVDTTAVSSSGHCHFTYVVQNDTSNHLNVIAQFSPEDKRLVPVNSSQLVLPVEEKKTVLSLYTQQSIASYGDTIEIDGQLKALDGTAVAGRRINILVNDRPAGNTMTADDGSYHYYYPVTAQTPGGLLSIYATYSQNVMSGDLYLSSRSTNSPVEIQFQDTVLTFFSSNNTLIGGDNNVFYGRLTTRSGMPVTNATVAVFDGLSQVASKKTDDEGKYVINWTVPVNYFDGVSRNHSLYAWFSSDNRSLNGVSSSKMDVEFGETNASITATLSSSLLFVNDVFNIKGRVINENGHPIAGQDLSINLADMTIVNVTTDDNGKFGYMKKISMQDQLGMFPVSVSFLDNAGYPRANAGTVVIFPFNIIALGFILVAILPIVLYIILRITGLNRMIITRMGWNRPVKVKRKRSPSPLPVNKPLVSTALPAEPVNIDAEMAAINSLRESGEIKKAMLRIYLVIKKIAAYRGIEVRDSMTHREICRQVTSSYATVSKPMRAFIGEYEVVNFGNIEPREEDVARSIESLDDIYGEVSSRKPEDSTP